MENKKKDTRSKRGLIATLAPMTWKERIEHIWLNYKVQLALIIVIPIMIISIIVSIFSNRSNLLLSGVLANVTISDEGTTYIKEDLFEFLEGNKESRDEVRVEDYTFTDLSYSTQFDYDYNVIMAMVNRVNAGEVDYFIMNEYALRISITQQLLLDLNEIYTEEELAAFDEDGILIKAQEEESDVATPIAINISGIDFAKDCIEEPDKVYLAFAVSTPQKDNCRIFWDYLMAWGQE